MKKIGLLLLFVLNITAESSAFVSHNVTRSFAGVSGLVAGDLDGDGHTDLVGASFAEDKLVWWKNSGDTPPVWEKREIDAYAEAIYVEAADVDGDGDLDVLSTASVGGDRVSWWRNEGNAAGWTKIVIDPLFSNAHGIAAADVDGDGDMDVMATSERLNRINWWENGDGVGESWVEHEIARNFTGTQTVAACDMDGDGRVDAVAGAGGSNEIAWWRNEGGDPVTWTKQVVDSEFGLPHWVQTADINGDGHVDVVAAGFTAQEIAWWENSGQTPPAWTKHSLCTGFQGAFTVVACDLDQDGDMDVAGTAGAVGLAWWRNDGNTWTEESIRAPYAGAWPLCAADLDGDGDVDLAAGSQQLGHVDWFENQAGGSAVQMGSCHALPHGFELKRNRPNPFNPDTVIPFSLTHSQPVSLTILDSRGRRVRGVIYNEIMPSGDYQIDWNGQDDHGRPVASGLYFSQLTVGARRQTRKMMLIE